MQEPFPAEPLRYDRGSIFRDMIWISPQKSELRNDLSFQNSRSQGQGISNDLVLQALGFFWAEETNALTCLNLPNKKTSKKLTLGALCVLLDPFPEVGCF